MVLKDDSFKKWFPLPLEELDTMYDVHSVNLGSRGLTVMMLPDGKRKHELKSFSLSWEAFIAYQVSEESFREDCWVASPKEAWSFWVSEASEYMQSFKNSSVLFPDDVIHFLFVGTNLITGVLAVGYPKIEYCEM